MSSRKFQQTAGLVRLFLIFCKQQGEISENEMLSVFNCGIGMAVIVADADVDSARKILESHGEMVFNIGEILPADATVI